MTDTAVVSCNDVSITYGETAAVDGLSFDAFAGRVLAILGPNGAGKTSTVEALEGYRIPSHGSIRVLGCDPAKSSKSLSARIGVMLQEGGIHPMMSPIEAARLFASYYHESLTAIEIIRLAGLEDVAKRPYKKLSGGEKQRLSLGLALTGRPEVVFLDEPTAGVDPQGRVGIRDIITRLKEQGACIILTTHELPEAERLADEVLILNKGKKVMQGSVHELLSLGSKGAGVIRLHTASALDRELLAQAVGVDLPEVTEELPGNYLIKATGTPERIVAITTLLASLDIAIDTLTSGMANLEEAYLSLIGGDTDEG
jgi:ABC-2 type transport system ATP-binding protein